MSLTALQEAAKAQPLEFWQEEVRKAREERQKTRPGANKSLLMRDPETAAKALFKSAQGVRQLDICAQLGIPQGDFWRLNRRFYHLLQKKSPYRLASREGLVVVPKRARKSKDPRALLANIRRLGALIPHPTNGSYQDEMPEDIVNAAIRLGKRVLENLP